MRVLAYDRFTPGVTMETITPYLTKGWPMSGWRALGRECEFEDAVEQQRGHVAGEHLRIRQCRHKACVRLAVDCLKALPV